MSREVVVGLIIVVAGILGGTANFARTRTEQSRGKDWFWAVVIGIVASFLVPLFLNTISSNLLDKMFAINLEPSIPFLFFGFCLLGAITSKAMIQTLTDRLIKETQATREEVSELKREVDPLINKETESDKIEGESNQLPVVVEEKHRNILNVLKQSEFTLRSKSGIAKDLGRDREEVLHDLNALAKSGLVTEVQGRKGVRWALTPSGREKILPDA